VVLLLVGFSLVGFSRAEHVVGGAAGDVPPGVGHRRLNLHICFSLLDRAPEH